MYFLNTAKTQNFDILLTTTLHWLSHLIRLGTGSDISHASLLVDSHVLIDSTGDGVHTRNIHRIEYEDECSIHLMRLKNPLNDEQRKKIEIFVRDKVGMRYNKIEALKSGLAQRGLLSPGDDEQRMFCSRLVAEAYKFAGINLVENPQYCTPEDLKRSSLLYEIEDVSCPFPNEFFVSVNNCGRNFDEEMRIVTNRLLNKVRKFDDGIETLTDIVNFLLRHPEKDDEILSCYQESGYLTLEDEIFKQTSYLYDEAQFMIHYLKDNFAKRAKIGASEDSTRYNENLAIFKKLREETNLKTFDALVNLYAKLVNHADLRKKTCEKVLHSLDGAPAFKRMMGLG